VMPGLRALAAALREGRVTAVELVEQASERAAVASNVFIAVNPGLASLAQGIDRARRDSQPLPPLAGIPIALKDLFDVRNEVTLAGSRVLAHEARPATADAAVVAPLREEGLFVAAAGALWFIVGAAAVAHDGRLSATIGAAAEFVEQGLRLLVNTVSFARVGAFALAHTGLSVAIIEMAQASGSIGYWIVLALGNVLVIMLEGVVVSIQTTRLLLFEFFIRFLTGAGRAFKPLPPPILKNLSEPTLGGTS